MSDTPSSRRKLANTLAARAARVLPKSEVEWGRGMSSEVHSIEDDREALKWAAGCLRTAIVLRTGSLLTQHSVLRVILGIYLATWYIMPAWLVAMILAYRSGDAARLQELASRTNVTDAQPFVALFDASAMPLLFVLITSSGLYLAGSIALMIRRAAGAFQLLLAGMILNWCYWFFGFSFSPESFAPFVTFGWLTNVSTWIDAALIAWLWCARKSQCHTV